MISIRKFLQKRVKIPQDYRDIPVIINNFNRLEFLAKQIEWLRRAGMRRIIILDNASTYPPLLDFYCNPGPSVEVKRLRRNLGYKALWKTSFFYRFWGKYHIYTDPDVVPVDECPLDAIDFLLKALIKYPDIGKVGFSLRMDDIPDHYTLKAKVLRDEKAYTAPMRDGFYEAPIDTTFALYRPFGDRKRSHWKMKALRTPEPYIARHLPWYVQSDSPNEEFLFYKKTQDGSSNY